LVKANIGALFRAFACKVIYGSECTNPLETNFRHINDPSVYLIDLTTKDAQTNFYEKKDKNKLQSAVIWKRILLFRNFFTDHNTCNVLYDQDITFSEK
jgi:hypothetical protein